MTKQYHTTPGLDHPQPKHSVRSLATANWVLVVLILLGAAGFRSARLGEVPPGVTHDEAAHLHDARRIWEGARPLYLTSGHGREPFYDYATAPLVGLLGTQVFTGRFSSLLWGMALVALTYAAVRRLLGRSAALGATLLMAVSFWPLSTSRQALRSITMPVLFVAALILFWQGVYGSRYRVGFCIGAGALLGLGFYTYMPARATWVAPLAFWLSLALTDRTRFRGCGRGVVAMVLVMAAVAAPLLVYLALHPGLEVRVAELAWPLRRALEGNWESLLQQMKNTALMFSHRGDTHWMYNLSGQPLLPSPLAVLFYIGLAIALARLREPGPRLLLLWLLAGVVPALVTGVESCSLRAIAAQPAVFALCALPFSEVGRWPRNKPTKHVVGCLSFAILLLLAVWAAVDTAQTYFVTWANHRDVRVAYYAHLAAEAAYLEQATIAEPVGVSTLYPDLPHDPSAMEVLRGEADPDLRWFDGQGAVIFSPSEEARLLLPTSSPLDPELEALVAPFALPLPPIPLHPTDFVTQVAVLEWDAEAALTDALSQAEREAGAYPSDDLPSNHVYQPLTLPVELGDSLALLGYHLPTPAVEPGGELVLVTFWQVFGPAGENLVLFAHLLDDESQILGQSDRLDAPSWNWHAGDVFAQAHRFSLPADAEPGRYHLQVGAYRLSDGSRLPLLVEAQPVDNRVLLQPVEVGQP